MTIKKDIFLMLVTLFITTNITFFTPTAMAEEDTKKKDCKPPRLRSLKPENHAEVAPESEFSFTLPVWTDPEKVTVTVKKIPTDVVVEDHNSFFLVKGKLPESLENTYARISVRAVANLGCIKRDGWLVKISARTNAQSEPKAESKQLKSTPENISEKQPVKTQ